MSAKADRIIELAQQGLKPLAIAEKLCVTPSTVQKVLADVGKAERASDNQSAKGQVAKIVELANGGLRPAEIAIQLGVKPQSVHNALTNARKAGLAVAKFASSGELVAPALPPPCPCRRTGRAPDGAQRRQPHQGGAGRPCERPVRGRRRRGQARPETRDDQHLVGGMGRREREKESGMKKLRTRLRQVQGVEWDGTPEATADLLRITECPLRLTRLAGGVIELDLTLEKDPGAPPLPVNIGDTVIVGMEGDISVWGPKEVGEEFEADDQEPPRRRRAVAP